jgi:hypothetical protein
VRAVYHALQHPTIVTLMPALLWRLALLAALALALIASQLAPLAAHSHSTGGAFSAQPATAMYVSPKPSCSSLPAPCLPTRN